jgi:hypothetical protein
VNPAVTIREVAPGVGHFRATIPDQGVGGVRFVGYALPLGQGRFLVRVPGALARTVHSQREALAVLRGDPPVPT